MAIDIACGMEVDPDDPGAVTEIGGRTYYFCSEGCRKHFESDPQKYLSAEFPFLNEIDGMQTPRLPYGGAAASSPSTLSTRTTWASVTRCR